MAKERKPVDISATLIVRRETAASLLDVDSHTIDEAIRSGALVAYRLGRRVLIRREDLLAFATRVVDTRAAQRAGLGA
jgi:excisionase family DNA binding protein